MDIMIHSFTATKNEFLTVLLSCFAVQISKIIKLIHLLDKKTEISTNKLIS